MFPCEKCGECCKRVGTVELGKDLALPSGICRYLNQTTNLCAIYEKRPIFCNVDAYYEKNMSLVMSKEEFYRVNKLFCRCWQNKDKP